jgi:hypothetical protein
VLCDTIVNEPIWATTESKMAQTYLLEFFGEAAQDELESSLLAKLTDDSLTRTPALHQFAPRARC